MKPKMLKQPRSKLTKKHLVAGAIILALAFGFWGVSVWMSARGESVVAETPPVSASELPFRHPLTGEPSAEAVLPPGVYAVMIDNSVDAWPASGVDHAFLVIEAPVEAAIPRLEAFFSADVDVEKIGPVRSARPYFVDWANEFDALYAHVGGSNAALDLIASTGTFDLNEFYNGVSFWRSGDRFAPHNAYTSTELLAAAVEKGEERGRAPEVLYGVWIFKDGRSGQDGQNGQGGYGDDQLDQLNQLAQSISVKFNSDLYTVDWDYDAATNAYLRSQGGRETSTADGVRLAADNVTVIVTDMEVVDYVGRREVRTTGEGKAWLLQDGTATEVTWKKPSVSERLAFYDAEGNEIAMNAGVTWVEVVADESDVTVR